MRALLIIVSLLIASFSGYAQQKNKPQFEYPFLLGEWYVKNPSPDQNSGFRAIKIKFDSNYIFQIDVQKIDYSLERWQGIYNANADTLVLGLNTATPQIYAYQTTHNKLNLNGITFVKSLSRPLAGMWSSTSLSGADILASKVARLDLILQPDFIFMFRVSGEGGAESIKRGVYYVENNRLVLLYDDGETASHYSLVEDKLTLYGQGVDMQAELARIR
ncbi:hypothetical protein [Vibrio gallicus]|uniref:hypothetical protein n=1 Tax=Vibrio gallicus TaxID=190897 RepID=UPI0021C29379|nr:hypothetical protein [Vibrio gallicus]